MTEARPSIPAAAFRRRLETARAALVARRLDALLCGVGADLRYLAGYDAMPLERLTMLVVPSGGDPVLVAPRLEAARAEACPAVAGGAAKLLTYGETDDSAGIVASVVVESPGRQTGRLDEVAVSDTLWASFVLPLQAALSGARFRLASAVTGELRAIKDADELALLRLAAEAADRVVTSIAAGPLVGRTESEVSREVRERLVAEGHDEASFAIVGSGPNSASPHHEASDRVIRAGEPIVLDIGGSLGGYHSDVTRTLWVTGGDPARGPDADFLGLYATLQRAQAAASAAVAPGVAAERIDATARAIIEAAGHGPHFFHRTGHGIGLEEHEGPWIVDGNATPLRPGMAFSVEPGIYLEGRYGARIEDIVVCGEDGPIALNRVARDLFVVAG